MFRFIRKRFYEQVEIDAKLQKKISLTKKVNFSSCIFLKENLSVYAEIENFHVHLRFSNQMNV